MGDLSRSLSSSSFLYTDEPSLKSSIGSPGSRRSLGEKQRARELRKILKALHQYVLSKVHLLTFSSHSPPHSQLADLLMALYREVYSGDDVRLLTYCNALSDYSPSAVGFPTFFLFPSFLIPQGSM